MSALVFLIATAALVVANVAARVALGHSGLAHGAAHALDA